MNFFFIFSPSPILRRLSGHFKKIFLKTRTWWEFYTNSSFFSFLLSICGLTKKHDAKMFQKRREKKGTFFFLRSWIRIYHWQYERILIKQWEQLVLFFFKFIYLWLCWVFVSVRGLSLVVASGGHSSLRCAGPLTVAASLVVEHRLQTRRLSNCGSRVQLLRGMWDLPRPGLEPVSPALAGRFSTTAPPGKPPRRVYFKRNRKEWFWDPGKRLTMLPMGLKLIRN